MSTAAARLVCIAGTLALASASLASPPSRVRAVLLEGQTFSLPQGGSATVRSINDVFVNSRGDWIALTNQFSSTDPEMAIVNGVVVYAEGQPIEAPTGFPTVRSWASNLPAIANNGDIAWNLSTVLGSSVEGGLRISGAIAWAFYEGDTFNDGPFLYGQWSSVPDVKINDNRQVFIVASMDVFGLGSSIDRAFVRVTLNGDGVVSESVKLLGFGDTIPGYPGETMTGGYVGELHNAFNNAGDWIASPIFSGDAARSDLVVKNNQILLQEGSPAPIAGRNWGSLAGFVHAVDLNDAGSWVLRAPMTGDTATDQIIVKDGVKFFQEGDPFPPNTARTVTSIATMAVRLDDAGIVWWYADTNDTDTTRDQFLMRGTDGIAQEGVTPVEIPSAGGEIATLRAIDTGTSNFAVADNGKFAAFKGRLANRPGASGDTDILALIEVRCPADFNGSGGIPDIDDIIAFFEAFNAGEDAADANWSGGVPDIDDVLYFFEVFNAGGCD